MSEVSKEWEHWTNSSSFETKVLNSYLHHNLYLIKTENVIKSILILSAGRRLSFNTLLNQLSGTLFYCNIKTACCFLPFLHISWSSEEESAWLLELSKITKVGNLPPWFWCSFIWKQNGKSVIWKFQRIWNIYNTKFHYKLELGTNLREVWSFAIL